MKVGDEYPRREVAELMNIDAIESQQGSQSLGYTLASRDVARPKGDYGSDLPPTQFVQESAKADRVEISDVGRKLAALGDQTDDSPELQLPPEKLQEMATS